MMVEEIISRVSMSALWRALGGGELRRGRGQAFWRDGNGWNVSLCDAKGSWFDHRDNIGGGLLDFVVHVRGGSRQDALHLVAELAGVPLDNQTPAERSDWIRAAKEMERLLPSAEHWRATALALCEEQLVTLKEAPLATIQASGIAWWTRQERRLRRLTGASLLEVYKEALSRDSALVIAMVRRAVDQERLAVRAILRYLGDDAA